MDSDDDFELLSDEAAPPVREKKLKRLKKAITVSKESLVDQSDSGRVNSFESEALGLEELKKPSRLRMGSEGLGGEDEMNSEFDGLGGEGEMKSGFDGLGREGEMISGFDGLDGLDGEGELNTGFDGLGGESELNSGFDGLGGGEDGSGARRALDFESEGEEFGEKSEDQNQEMREESGDRRMEESDKKRPSSDGFDEEKDKKKNKRAKSGGDDAKTQKKAADKGKRRTEKERRDHLKQLHAESQRLLRETRDAAFKPIPLVQKPISSILEKIRKRKLEVLKKSINKNSTIDDNSGFSGEIMEDRNSESAPVGGKGDTSVLKAAIEEPIACQTEMVSRTNGVCMDGSSDNIEHSSCEKVSSMMDVDEESKQVFRAPIGDTQELFSDSPTTESKDELPNDTPSSPLEEVLAPSILAMNLKFDSAPPDDVSSSDEEDNDKENIKPHPPHLADLPSSPIYDPVKAFVDDEAEEEDDSDHDLSRFQDSDEDEDDEDAEDLNDMIATGYKEEPIDSERRNELHQKWLEQQDDSGTEHLMQKLKFGSKLIETTLLEEKDAGGEDEEFGDEAAEDLVPKNDVQVNLRKVKQMIPQMFTDDNDEYSSSDDEETENRLSKQCMVEKAGEQVTFLSPAEDESSREFFGLIKKLNIVPDTRKAKTSSFSNILLMGGNKIISSKSSFLGRGSNHSLPSSRNHGLSTTRSFIFERDDSNSRSTTLVSEDSSDMIQRENQPTRTASAKFSNPQVKTQKSSPAAVAKTDTSLFEILRRSSLQETKIDNPESVLAAFKLRRKSVEPKEEPYVHRRS